MPGKRLLITKLVTTLDSGMTGYTAISLAHVPDMYLFDLRRYAIIAFYRGQFFVEPLMQ